MTESICSKGLIWRLLKNWYLGGRCKVRLDGICSEGFEVERGVKQGSVLSPVLFVIMMVVSPASLLDSQHGCIASPHAKKESGQTP